MCSPNSITKEKRVNPPPSSSQARRVLPKSLAHSYTWTAASGARRGRRIARARTRTRRRPKPVSTRFRSTPTERRGIRTSFERRTRGRAVSASSAKKASGPAATTRSRAAYSRRRPHRPSAAGVRSARTRRTFTTTCPTSPTGRRRTTKPTSIPSRVGKPRRARSPAASRAWRTTSAGRPTCERRASTTNSFAPWYEGTFLPA